MKISFVDFVTGMIMISYILYRTMTPKKGEENTTYVGRFFKALFKSLLVLLIIIIVVDVIYYFFLGATLGGIFSFLAVLVGH